MPLLTGWFPSQSGGDEVRESRMDAFSNPIPWQLTWVQWFALQNMLAESDLPEYRKPSSDTAMMKPTARSGSFGAPMTGMRPKRSAAVKRRRWRPWFWVLPRKRMLHPSLKQSSVRCAKQQSWSEFTGSKTPRLRVTASASFSMSGRCHPERRSRCFSPTGIRMATVSLFSGRTSPSSRRRRRRISAASDKSFARWSFRFTTRASARTASREQLHCRDMAGRRRGFHKQLLRRERTEHL